MAGPTRGRMARKKSGTKPRKRTTASSRGTRASMTGAGRKKSTGTKQGTGGGGRFRGSKQQSARVGTQKPSRGQRYARVGGDSAKVSSAGGGSRTKGRKRTSVVKPRAKPAAPRKAAAKPRKKPSAPRKQTARSYARRREMRSDR